MLHSIYDISRIPLSGWWDYFRLDAAFNTRDYPNGREVEWPYN